METKRAEKKADGAGEGVKEKQARRAVQFLNGGTELHQRHHVEADANQSTVQKHRRNQTPPFMVNENRIGIDRAEFDGSKRVHAPENVEASGFTRLDGEHQENREEEKVEAKHDGRDGRFEVRYDREFLGDGRQRKREVGAAFV